MAEPQIVGLDADDQIQFDTNLPGVDDATIRAFEQATGEEAYPEGAPAEEEPEQEASAEDPPAPRPQARPVDDEPEDEPDVDWQARAAQYEAQIRQANNAAAQARIQQRRIEERIEMLIEAQRRRDAAEAAAVEPEPEPDFDESPDKWLDARLARTKDEIAEAVRRELEGPEPTPQEQANEALNTYLSTAQQYEAQFRQQAPDYDEAVSFAQEQLQNRARDMYGDAPLLHPQTGQPVTRFNPQTGLDESVPRYLYEANKAEMALVAQWLQNGQNPAEAYYHRAKEWGFAGQEQEAEEAPPPSRNAEAARVRNGLAKNRSLSKSSGARTKRDPNELSFEKFAQLSESNDPDDRAIVDALWHYDGGRLAHQLMKSEDAVRLPQNFKPLYLS